MILHIALDDRFVDMAYRAFEDACPNANKFVLIGNKKPLKYIKNTPVDFISPFELLTGVFAHTLKEYDFVVIHWLDDHKIRLLRQADANVKFVWIGWGADYYDLICSTEKLLKPLTLNVFKELREREEQKKGRVKKIIKSIFFQKRDRKTIINRISFFSAPLREDYSLIKGNYPGFSPTYVSWNYGSLEDDLVRGFEGASASGNNILVGNSATLTNNHLDVFERLKRLELNGKKIICPLNYGDDAYKRLIILRGKELFADDFTPLCNPVELQDYLKILTSCAFTVMGHIRQQAGGNIITMLYLGTKVFLDPQNPWYKFFKEENTYIYALDDLEHEAVSRLTGAQIEHNREVLRKHWGRAAIRRKTRELILSVSQYRAGK